MRVLTAVSVAIVFVSLLWAESKAPTAGEQIYLTGRLASGMPVTGERDSGGSTSGSDAACVNCHRPSGLGMAEGRIVIPPITSRYLFSPGVLITSDTESHHVAPTPTGREAYTDATLAGAIRKGIGPDGRKLGYLMPRYNLDDGTMASLIAYLKTLSSGPVPGVTADTLHFATIITPDADPVERKGMLDVLQAFFATKNHYYRGESPPLLSPWRMMYRVQRMWQLHVWELSGPPETWEEQLRKRLRAEPVFAVIAGLGGKDWAPVHRFCQEESLPCLFPNVDLPVIAEGDFYNVYFSKGVLLEAQLIDRQLSGAAAKPAIHRVVQVFRNDDIGAAAAGALRDEVAARGLRTDERELGAAAVDGELATALKDIAQTDALVLWLRPGDLRSLPAFPARKPTVFVSGLMGGLGDAPLPEEWRGAANMTYPLELPQRRGVLMDYPLGWFRIQRIPLVAERTQVDTYVACGILADALKHMLDNFVREYLVEKLEGMLSSRIINGNYLRLGLAPGQRFASKGGYIVHFAAAEGDRLTPEGDWMVP
jgi:hypothetical protein